MSCCGSNDDLKKSRQIEKKLRADKKKSADEVKILLLGAGESGKSTVFKQMKIIQDNGGFSTEDLLSYKFVVYTNLVTQMKVIVNAAFKLKVQLGSREAQEWAERVYNARPEDFNIELASDIKNLWADSGIQTTYDMRDTHYQLNDSASYFFNSIDRFISPSYIPTEQDVLRARIRSTGIEEAEFVFEHVPFRILDVGGQRSERRKWIHCFDCITAVIFCVALSEYDLYLREDETQNRMKESLMLFQEIFDSPWFRKVPFIIFFNKVDLFKEKIARIDLKICFPNYSGGKNLEPALAFIKARFTETNHTSSHPLYTHFTCAINTENIAVVFKVVREVVLKNLIGGVMMY